MIIHFVYVCSFLQNNYTSKPKYCHSRLYSKHEPDDCATVKIYWTAAVISMAFTELLLENALAIRHCNCDAASEPLLPKVACCIPVLYKKVRRPCTTAQVIPEITRNGPLIICRRDLLCYCTMRGIDQIQAFLKSYSECSYITDLVSVINFYINRYVTLEITQSQAIRKTVLNTDQYSNTATCKLIVSVLGSSRW